MRIFACSALILLTSLSAAGAIEEPAKEVKGYGPWLFGMTQEQVAGVAQFAPYTPVSSTGGLETANGELEGRKTNISFVFKPTGLAYIQIWAYTGRDFGKATEAWHTVYQHLTRNFGPVQHDKTAVAKDLSAEQMQALLPPDFKPGEPTFSVEELKRKGSLQLSTVKYQLEPVTPPNGATVFASLIHSAQLGSYWVFLYYRAPNGA